MPEQPNNPSQPELVPDDREREIQILARIVAARALRILAERRGKASTEAAA